MFFVAQPLFVTSTFEPVVGYKNALPWDTKPLHRSNLTATFPKWYLGKNILLQINMNLAVVWPLVLSFSFQAPKEKKPSNDKRLRARINKVTHMPMRRISMQANPSQPSSSSILVRISLTIPVCDQQD